MKQILHILLIGIITFILLEVIVRLCDVQPFQAQPYGIQSNPNFCLIPNDVYGLGLNTGRFNVTINENVKYSCTHDLDSFRIVSHKPILNFEKMVDIHGCSFTYGMSVSDSLTFPFLLQTKHPNIRFRNYSVPGFGNIQALIRLKKQIQTGDLPDVFVVCYADFHNERNVLNTNYRKSLYHGFLNANETILPLFEQSRIPYYDLEKGVQYCRWDNLYHNWNGRNYLASINTVQEGFENMILKDGQEETYQILSKINQLCKKNEVELIIATITKSKNTMQTIDFCKHQNIPVFDIGLKLPSEEYSQLPYDIHPNKKAHEIFARRLNQLL